MNAFLGRSLSTLVLVVGAVATSGAHAAWQTLTGATFDLAYDDGLMGLFGAPTLIGDNIVFTPINFKAESLSGAGVVTANSTVNVRLRPHQNQMISGVALVERDMLRALERHGVRPIDPKGEKFDPNFHQAMFELPDPSLPNGTVAQVMQIGYVIGDRVLRPALVGVARGGPKVAAEAGASIDKTA